MSALLITPHPVDGTFGPHDSYPEAWWLPTIGPTSYLAWRLCAAELAHRDQWLTSDHELAVRLGLGAGRDPHPALRRTLRRLERFNVLELDHDAIALRCRLPYLPEHYRQRLATQLAEAPDVGHLTSRR